MKTRATYLLIHNEKTDIERIDLGSQRVLHGASSSGFTAYYYDLHILAENSHYHLFLPQPPPISLS